jgi:hypothetical protein
MSLIEDCAGLAGAEPQTWGMWLTNNILFVGLDVHKATIAVAVAEGPRGGEIRDFGNFVNHPDHIRKLVERLAKGGRPLSFCCEAGHAAMAFIVTWWPLATVVKLHGIRTPLWG